ncbi:dephospho-CoA kinase [Leptospira borgpetersenii serovar Mini str. 201000851]|uniref:Dephospho-CoA kinase n=2 Tax=Leptospira borgpetersenii TaxID=174 RepID=M3GM94_LEPBO|nr:dephospho-CoA kinase [Leptospira borgpetersenii str. 200801926]EKQ92425.1 dephospho-CoA kinase [Leptospira borgpetersenii str. UI 09149]EMG02092.1 dephospho-CoA kinase [Leptospira borgpetersenii str. 200701203]EMN58195.1 dephospho-CoA kinase [Leptospira borgpetersenii serovar Javanica str. MK146]ENO64029.1 dephospho-CoA kinase [Leptospira borgpetersenii serovar Mini str. 201000851]PTM48952.1 dephospho-CoA kinase [Leptospira borgpetersenii serovar Javanica]
MLVLLSWCSILQRMQSSDSGKEAFLVGITGMIGGGKSTVVKILEELGGFGISADRLAKRYTEIDSPILPELVGLLGKGILDSEGKPDRKKISDIVFNDAEKLAGLNRLIHPKVREDFQKILKTQARGKIVIWEVPLLFETDAYTLCNATVAVDSDPEESILRTISRDRLKKEDVLARISSQLPITEKLKRADYIIRNKGNLETLKEECKNLYSTLLEKML